MTQTEFVNAYHDFCEKPIFGGDIPTDDELRKLHGKVVGRFGDVPSDYFTGANCLAMGYLCNLDHVLGREQEVKHIHEWLHEYGLWK